MTAIDEHDTEEQNLTKIDKNELIWELSPRGKYAHAYTGQDELAAGIPLCGLSCRPAHVLEHFDLSDEIYHAVACPDCLARMPYAHLLRPVSAFCRPQKSEEVMGAQEKKKRLKITLRRGERNAAGHAASASPEDDTGEKEPGLRQGNPA